jgi:hypothetical protein
MDRREIDSYDLVLIGLAPITSVAANYAYGALWLIDYMHGSKKLRYFVDAPEPVKIVNAANALADSPGSLFKPFYSARPEFAQARDGEVAEKITRGVTRLSGYTWAKTIYPALPWGNHGSVVSSLPVNVATQLQCINVDSMLLDKVEDAPARDGEPSERFWAANDMKSQWTLNVEATLKTPVVPIKEHKGWTDADVVSRMRDAVGVLVAPSKSTGSWWTPRVVQSLSVGTPVVTDWRESAIIGDPWMDLAATVDEMSPQKRQALARAQLNNYKSIITPSGGLSKHVIDVLLPYAE